MLTFLLVVHALVAAALVAVILMQQSEGGGLASGGNPTGLMSARGASNFLTRLTSILAAIFVAMSILLAALASVTNRSQDVDTSLARARAASRSTPAPAPATPPASNNAVPLAQ